MIRRSLRYALRGSVAIVLTVSLVAAVADPGAAEGGPIRDPLSSRIDEVSEVDGMFTYTMRQGGWTYTETIEEVGEALHATIRAVNPAGVEEFSATAVVTRLSDSTTSVSIVSPQLVSPVVRSFDNSELRAADPVCWPCVAAAGVAAGLVP